MSHIVTGKVGVRYTDRNLLIRALSPHGNIYENESLYEVGNGLTRSKYQLVLVAKENNQFRIGYNLVEGTWKQFQENYGSVGAWTQRVTERVQDRYLAFGYEKQLISEGFEVTVTETKDGSFEVVALEEMY
ncbi:MAG: hypothetical protein EOO52_12920 [Gammaproteobacteria bacterium]|nr:MAG: hypothetical protein EOO52_12920 [Gammaproteobacteria bacterium]